MNSSLMKRLAFVGGVFFSLNPIISSCGFNKISKDKHTLRELAARNTSCSIRERASMAGYAGYDFDVDYKTGDRMFNYFNNLYDYSPLNEVGTCGFVSLIQVLSYFDTFVDEAIIEEKYEKGPEYVSPLTQDSSLPSPGVSKYSYDGVYFESEKEWAEINYEKDYQAKLIYDWNEKGYPHVSKSKQEIESPSYQLSINAYNTCFFFSYCMDGKGKAFYHENNFDTNSEMMKWVKKEIDGGTPVILNIIQTIGGKKGSQIGDGHAVVAYDYDEENLYANFGWEGKGTAHKNVLSERYNRIASAVAIDFAPNNGSKSRIKIGNQTFTSLQFQDRAILDYGTCFWKHTSDKTEFFDVEIGFEYDGQYEAVISGSTTYNCFQMTDHAWNYFMEEDVPNFYVKIKRYERNGIIKFDSVITLFPKELYV